MLTIDKILALRPKAVNYKDQPISRSTIVQEKLDGWRMTVFRFDEVRVIGRKKYINYWEYFRDDPRILDLPPGTVLDGEYHGNTTGADVPTLLREGSGEFVPWAMPWFNGAPQLSYSIPTVNNMLEDLGFHTPITFEMGDFSVEYLEQEAKESEIEGYVLKNQHWDGWYKVKPTKTFDLMVTSLVGGGVRGSIKSLCVSTAEGTEVGKVGGLTDEMRERTDLIGKIVEVCAQDVTRDGRLKFARLVRLREDLDTPNSVGDLIREG